MGLDMYLTGRKYFWQNWRQPFDQRMEDEKRVKSLDIELGYWRKHPNLHGYMVQEFGKGNDDCKEIELEADDLRKIIKAVKDKKLPKTEGFFFGESDGTESERDIKVLTEALDWLQASDESPVTMEKPIQGPGFTAIVMEAKPNDDKSQKVTRSVHYRGDW